MTFRTRLTLALLALAAVPLLVLGYGVRREMTARLDGDAAQRLHTASASVGLRVADLVNTEREQLELLATELANDNRLRTAVINDNSTERRWLLDWAASTMKLTGFAVLQLHDSTGRILSSGQFRNDYDRVAPETPRAIALSPSHTVVLDARTPSATVRALVSAANFTVRGEVYTVVGGVRFDSAQVTTLSPDAMFASALRIGSAPNTPALETAMAAAAIPYVSEAIGTGASSDAKGPAPTAHIVLIPDTGPTQVLKAGVTRWVLFTLGGTLFVAIVVATLLGQFIAAPIVKLSQRTEKLDLDKLTQRFNTGRDDELGVLESTLDALTKRLRSSAKQLREAERAAATGDLARQVNHDIKNGLAPIRNVLRHLAQTAEQEPDTLATKFAERRGTLESSVEYLDALARNYARLSPTLNSSTTDVRAVILEVARGVTTTIVEARLPETLPSVRADRVVLQRILDNLVSNAVDALQGKPGTVNIAAGLVRDGAEPRVRITVSDTGRGMSRDELNLAFNDFHTTKAAGTGLGLSVVRRLLTDINGAMRVETAPGEGSTFTIDIPTAAQS